MATNPFKAFIPYLVNTARSDGYEQDHIATDPSGGDWRRLGLVPAIKGEDLIVDLEGAGKVMAVRDEPQPLQAHLILKLWFRLFAANGSFWANRKADRALNPIFARFIPSTAAFPQTPAKPLTPGFVLGYMPSDLRKSSCSSELACWGAAADCALTCAINSSGSGASCDSKSFSLMNSVRSIAISR